jgi:hypothetical protein
MKIELKIRCQGVAVVEVPDDKVDSGGEKCR